MSKTKIIIISTIIIICIFVASLLAKAIFFSINRAEVPFELKYDVASKPNFYIYDKNIYYCTKDALQILDVSNNVLSTDTYTMNYPYIISNDSIVAVTEENGHELCVYNKDGMLYELSMPDPIISASLNNKGYSCVITKSNDMYKFDFYKPDKEKKSKLCIHGEFPQEQGIPFASAIDNQNNLFALSVFDISGVKMKTNVIFYYFQDENNSADVDTDSDCMLTSYSENEHISGIINFMNDNKFVSVSSNKLICSQINISGKEKRKEIWNVDFKNEVTAIDFINKNFVAVAYGEKLSASDDCETPYSVVIYDLNGNKKGTFKAEDKIDKITSYKNTVLCISGRTIYCIDKSAKLIWTYTNKQDILTAYPYINDKKVFIATDNLAKIYNMPFLETELTEKETSATEEVSSKSQETTKKETSSQTESLTQTTTKPNK